MEIKEQTEGIKNLHKAKLRGEENINLKVNKPASKIELSIGYGNKESKMIFLYDMINI